MQGNCLKCNVICCTENWFKIQVRQPDKCRQIPSWPLSWGSANHLLKSPAPSRAAPPKTLLLWLAPVPIVPGGWLSGYESHCSKMAFSSLLLGPCCPLLNNRGKYVGEYPWGTALHVSEKRNSSQCQWWKQTTLSVISLLSERKYNL